MISGETGGVVFRCFCRFVSYESSVDVEGAEDGSSNFSKWVCNQPVCPYEGTWVSCQCELLWSERVESELFLVFEEVVEVLLYEEVS